MLIRFVIMSLPSWEAWIEVYRLLGVVSLALWSLPSWEAWIEVKLKKDLVALNKVASLMGSVD